MTSAPFKRKPLRAAAVLLALSGAAAHAQNFVERNPPPAAPRGDANALRIDTKDIAGSTDETPLGAGLVGVRLIGLREAVPAETGTGVTFGAIGGEAPREKLAGAIAPFLDRPLSRKLISDIEAAIAKVYRDTDHPFVAVSLPPQDATKGVITLRVAEFHLGKVGASEAGATAPERASQFSGDIRTTPGGRIDSASLEEDLDWLNRNPFRRVQGVFAPGDELGTSNLTLDVTESKPWQVFAGFANTGTKSTGENRFFIGGAAVIPALNNTLLSYQFTGGDDLGDDRPKYLSHSARITIPTGSRQALEIAGNYVATKQEQDILPGVTLRTDNDTYEIPVLYRSAISNLIPGAHVGDILFGFEAKHAEREVFFAGAPLGQGDANLFQFVGGWSWTPRDAYGTTAIDFRLKANPGHILDGNDDTSWSNFTGGRVTHADYVYGTLDVTRTTPLPGDMSWVVGFDGILAGSDLPDTELMAPGGYYGVRGYILDDGTFDKGFTLRNELHLPGTDVIGNDELSPYVFFDYGYGRSGNTSVNLASLGAGLDYRLSSNLSAGAALGFALRDAAVSSAGDARFVVRITLSY